MQIPAKVKREIGACAVVVSFYALLYDVCETRLLARGMESIYAELSDSGFQVTYYEGEEFGKRTCSRSERHVARNYERDRPCRRLGRNHWSARWEGILAVPVTTNYTFFLQSDDGARLFIDDNLIIDHWSDHGWKPGKHGSVSLAQGECRVRIEHYDREGPAAIRLRWAGGSIPDNTVLGATHVRKRQ